MLGGKRVRDAGKALREKSSPVLSCPTRLLSLIKRAHGGGGSSLTPPAASHLSTLRPEKDRT